eukprot:XP_020404624.1 uncharacterized protein LOC103649024 [Zea mays]
MTLSTAAGRVMERDRQDAAQKRRAVVRIADPMREAKKARGSAKAAASSGSKPVPATKPAAPGAQQGVSECEGCRLWREQAAPERAHERTRAFNQYHGAGSGEGQLAVVPPSVATTSPTVVAGVKGAARDPWATFCASGEIMSAAAAKDLAGSMSQRLREASQQLSLQLKRAADFADHVASGALTADVAAEVESLRAQHADAMAHAEDVEDLGGLDGALPEAVEVDPVLPSDAGEGPSATPTPTAAAEDPAPAPTPTGEDTLKVVAEPAAEPASEDPTAMAGPSQVAE